VPVVGATGELVGMLEEVDLLNHMLENMTIAMKSRSTLVQNAGAVFPAIHPSKKLCPPAGYALLVVENSKPIGILTKIDVLDYVAGKI
jgi:predicted transcriptional regulator